MLKKKTYTSISLALLGTLSFWLVLHLPGIFYGTQDTPLHVSYMTADEQSPINGALHMLKDRSILGLKNQNTLYYGPVLALLALPAVVADYSINLLKGAVAGGESYKDFIVWDWGGILQWARVIAVCGGFLGLLAVYLIFDTKTVNRSRNQLAPFIASFLLAGNYLYFEYANFFRHWIFIVVIILWQIYFGIRIFESKEKRALLWSAQTVLTIFVFGISYSGIVFLVFWVPFLLVWFKEKQWKLLKEFLIHALIVLLGCAVMVWWHPYAFLRVLGLVGAGVVSPLGAISPVPNIESSLNPFLSLIFYTKVLLVNNFFLILGGFIVLTVHFREMIYKSILPWVFLVPAVVNYAIFSSLDHHETRYIFPVSVLLTLFVYALFYEAYQVYGWKDKSVRLATVLVVLSFIINCLQIVLWQRMILVGPPERREVISQIHEWQAEDPNTKTLVIKGWPLGYVHTHSAYEDYIARYNKKGYDLWQYILTLNPPEEIKPLKVYYIHTSEELTSELQEKYDHIIKHAGAKAGDDIAKENPNDEFDIRPWHLWNFEKYQESFTVIK
ncbi:MAG: hypothetical protein UV60_C0014G0008 [Parcubacteria group bacterium GW2011_GWA2_43_11]|nr:MAG: hypothetical protein UV60_C0014G0008 [Parcubacteria group bacterium GW2011_GWA2_43_11]